MLLLSAWNNRANISLGAGTEFYIGCSTNFMTHITFLCLAVMMHYFLITVSQFPQRHPDQTRCCFYYHFVTTLRYILLCRDIWVAQCCGRHRLPLLGMHADARLISDVIHAVSHLFCSCQQFPLCQELLFTEALKAETDCIELMLIQPLEWNYCGPKNIVYYLLGLWLSHKKRILTWFYMDLHRYRASQLFRIL